MKPTYPLSSLESLRAREVKTREKELAEALGAATRAKAQADDAAAKRARFDAVTSAQRTELQGYLESGEARIADLANATAWRQQRSDERDAHAAEEREATRAAEAKRSEFREAQRELGDAQARAKAIERHREAWRDAAQRKYEAAEEEAAEDVWTSNHTRRA